MGRGQIVGVAVIAGARVSRCDAFDWLYKLGCEGRPRMMSIGLHGRIIGRPGRMGSLVRLLEHIQGHTGVWLCSREQIARHWIAHHPPTAAPSTTPSR